MWTTARREAGPDALLPPSTGGHRIPSQSQPVPGSPADLRAFIFHVYSF